MDSERSQLVIDTALQFYCRHLVGLNDDPFLAVRAIDYTVTAQTSDYLPFLAALSSET